MTIWSSQLRHNFFNHTLFSCVEQEIDRIKGCVLRNVACCVGISTAVLWFSTESKSSDYPGLSPSALHPETQENRVTSWGALGEYGALLASMKAGGGSEEMDKTREAKNL